MGVVVGAPFSPTTGSGRRASWHRGSPVRIAPRGSGHWIRYPAISGPPSVMPFIAGYVPGLGGIELRRDAPEPAAPAAPVGRAGFEPACVNALPLTFPRRPAGRARDGRRVRPEGRLPGFEPEPPGPQPGALPVELQTPSFVVLLAWLLPPQVFPDRRRQAIRSQAGRPGWNTPTPYDDGASAWRRPPWAAPGVVCAM